MELVILESLLPRLLGSLTLQFFVFNVVFLEYVLSSYIYKFGLKSNFSTMSDPSNFTPSKAKAMLSDILEAVNIPENAMKIEQAKDNAGNDMIKMMQYVFPIMVQIQMDVIKNYGFPEGREGMVHFSQLIRNLEREDSDVAELHGQIRTHFLPPININTEASL